MAAARFQVLSALDRTPVPGTVSGGIDAVGDGPPPGPVTWRFMSANNRSLARSARTFPDVDSCLAAVRALGGLLPTAACAILRDGPRHWVWRVRVAGVDEVVSSRRYERRVQAANSCMSFLDLVGGAECVDLCQLVRLP